MKLMSVDCRFFKILGIAMICLTACTSSDSSQKQSPNVNKSDDNDRDPPVIVDKCGNGSLDTDEICDPKMSQVGCTTLGAIYTDGQAGCRNDCKGYDVSECSHVATDPLSTAGQYIIPKSRDANKYANALCSFGNPFGYRVSLSPTHSKTWVVFIQGGGACDGTITPCTDRSYGAFEPMYLNEQYMADIKSDPTAIGSRDPIENPTFHDANIAVAEYCTNDLWSGANTIPQSILVGPSNNPHLEDIVFTGTYNVASMFGTLVAYFGLDDRDDQTKIVYAGNSSGGDGVQNSSHIAIRELPEAAKDQRIWFVSSGGYSLATWDNPNYTIAGNGKTDFENFTNMADTYKSDISPECQAIAFKDGVPPAACLMGLYWYRTLTEGFNQHRLLVFKNRYDQLDMSYHAIAPATDITQAFNEPVRIEWRDKAANEILALKWVMSPLDPQIVNRQIKQDNLHGIFKRDLWDLLPPVELQANMCGTTAPTTFRDLLTRFFNEPDPNAAGEKYCPDGDWVTWAP